MFIHAYPNRTRKEIPAYARLLSGGSMNERNFKQYVSESKQSLIIHTTKLAEIFSVSFQNSSIILFEGAPWYW